MKMKITRWLYLISLSILFLVPSCDHDEVENKVAISSSNGKTQKGPFNISDFFPTSSKTNMAGLLDGTLITNEDLILALEVPDSALNYVFQLSLYVDALKNQQGNFSFGSPSWSTYTTREDDINSLVDATIYIPSDKLIGKVEIPFTYTEVGYFDLNVTLQNTPDDGPHELSKKIFWNTHQEFPSEIDTVIVANLDNPNANAIYGVTDGFERPTYLVFEGIDTLSTLRFGAVKNLIGVEFPELTTVKSEFTIAYNFDLRVFKAPQLETINGYLNFSNNPLIQIFDVPSLATIKDYVNIERNNRLETFNMGGRTFGADFSDIMKGYYLIRWKFNDQILKDSNF